jgi:predicted GIY-YIG superfamily endonuclease
MPVYVYLITRNDNKQYIGITIDMAKRISAHKRTKRFEIGIKDVTILKECETYEEAELLEPKYIKEYDTFHNGLNESINGKGNHLATNFSTKGHKFSRESRQKMKDNHWSTKMSCYWKSNHSENQKEKWSKLRKGVAWGSRKIPRENALDIIDSYSKDTLKFEDAFVVQFVKKYDEDKVGKVPLEELKAPNGKHLNKLKLYSEYYAKEFGVTPTAIKRILQDGISDKDAK